MTLRLTSLSNFLLFRQSLADRNLDVFRYSEQLSSQKRINRPSDDPVGAKAVLFSRESISKVDVYTQNLEIANTNLTNSEAAMTQVKDVISTAKELALRAKNATNGPDQRKAIAEEIQQLQLHLLELSNTQVNGEYIFAGYKTDTKPITLDAAQPTANPVATYAGSTGQKAIQISDSATLTFQVDGEKIFKGTQGGVAVAGYVDLFQTMANLEVACRNNDDSDTTGIGFAIDELDLGFKQVVNEISNIGAKTNRIESAKAHYVSQRDSLTEFISLTEDVDVSEVAFNYQKATLALQATIQSAGSVLNLPSLLDFIGK